MRTQKVEKSRNLAKVKKEKENKHENQIEVFAGEKFTPYTVKFRSVQFGANAKASCGSHVNPICMLLKVHT